MLGTVEAGKLLLKSKRSCARSTPPNSALEHFLQRFALTVIVLRPDGKRLLLGFFSSSDCEFWHELLRMWNLNFPGTRITWSRKLERDRLMFIDSSTAQ